MKLNKKIVYAVLAFAALIQLIIITYNYLTGYIDVSGPANFLIRLFIGTIFSFAFGMVIVIFDILIINRLDKSFPLPMNIIVRIPLELLLAITAGIIVGSSVTIIAGSIMPYEDALLKNIINNSLITSVINIILIASVEAVLWYKRGQESLIKAEQLEKENSQVKFEVLKSQVNPHFLFNSLNVLSTLIKKDQARAQNFVDEFASVYRYTLDVIEKPVVELRDELEFAKSFLYLQKIRFDNSVASEINVDASMLTTLVPPLAVQTLLENAFKHNKVSSANPLCIKLFNDNDMLIITNNLQPKMKTADSKGIGLDNLKKRYKHLGERQPQFTITEKEYIAKIPLIIPE